MSFRIELQAKVRQQGRSPGLTAEKNIESARQQLTALVQQLKAEMNNAGIVEIKSNIRPTVEPISTWDEIVNEPVPGGTDAIIGNIDPASTGPIQIENQIMPLPSNGNVRQEYAELELSHRMLNAERHLNRIRDLIAEKSFQYSHVIRASPRKAVNTRSRAEVKKLNLEISVQCRLYTHCRSRLITLGAPPAATNRLKELTPEHIKASTAIINPNEPGSTQLKLSWIWQSSRGHHWGLASELDESSTNTGARADLNIIECKFLFYSSIYTLTFLISVRRVHWLRSRAQFMRWSEEVTLTGYEMQWTVRYFQYMSRKWVLPTETGNVSQTGTGISSGTGMALGTGTGTHFLSPGASAYWSRKQAIWEELVKKADNKFRNCHPSYESPL
jgi:hypothetical protein